MNFVNIILIFFWLILIPFVIGKKITKKEENTIIYSWTIGNIFQMAIFFVISIICVLAKISFFVLWKLYSIILAIIFIVFFIKIIKEIMTKTKSNNSLIVLNKKIDIYKITAIILIILQLFVKVKYANVNDDDSSYVTLSKTMIQTGKMYYSDQSPELFARKALAPISAYFAAIAKQTGVDSTIITHSVMPIFLIIMSYCIYYKFAKKIFKDDEKSYITLIFLSILNLYSMNVKGISRYMLLYTWFGRSILGSITLPLIWKLSIDALNKESKILDWGLLFMAVLAAGLCSQMAVPLVSISLGCLALISTISDKKISYLFKTFICILPCILVGIFYIILK